MKEPHYLWYVLLIVIVIAIVLAGWMYFSSVGNMIIDGGGCIPKTCAQLGKSCGSWSDGCGGTVNCGTCPTYPTTSTIKITGRTRVTDTVRAADVGGPNVDVFWDSACTSIVNSIDWGTLSPGESKSILVYIKNTGSAAGLIQLTTSNWNPTIASNYLSVSWDYSGIVINASKSIPVHLILTVSPSITGITTFSNDININIIRYSALDVNGDGKVDMKDIGFVSSLFGAQCNNPNPNMPRYDAKADINGDCKVDMKDLAFESKYFGKLVW